MPQPTRTSPRQPADPPATFGEIGRAPARDPGAPPDFAAIAASPEFQDLRRRQRRFIFPMTSLFLLWYIGFVVLAAYLPELMAVRVVGMINVGLLLGLAQFLSTLLITALYVRFATRVIDPRVREIHLEATGEEPR